MVRLMAPNPELISIIDEAAEHLEKIAAISKVEIPHLGNLSCDGREFSFTPRGLWGAFFSYLASYTHQKEMREKRKKCKKEILRSIEVLKKHYRIIQRLKEGTTEEQKWAAKTIDAIQSYNTLLLRLRQKPKNTAAFLFRFFIEHGELTIIDDELLHNLVEIPSAIFIRFDSMGKEEGGMEKITSDLQAGKFVSYNEIERDIFTMRAISLAKSSLPQDITKDLNQTILRTPILAQQTEEEGNASVISMRQVLTPFPGEEITVQGRITRNSTSPVPIVPDTASFRVSTIASQTGFPHPSQYAGWALSNALTPLQILRIDLVPLFHSLFNVKKHLAASLLPGGRLNAKAKELLKKKKEVFDENREELLPLHAELSEAILGKSTITFHEMVLNHPSPFDYLSQTHHFINKRFIEKPHSRLEKGWYEEHLPGLLDKERKTRFIATQELMKEELLSSLQEIGKKKLENLSGLEKATLEFAAMQGKVLGEAGIAINLQYFSEIIGFRPPLLTDLEQLLQTSVFRQIFLFEKELQSDPTKDEILSNLLHYLKGEIALFKGAELPETAISEELERYYLSRFSYSE